MQPEPTKPNPRPYLIGFLVSLGIVMAVIITAIVMYSRTDSSFFPLNLLSGCGQYSDEVSCSWGNPESIMQQCEQAGCYAEMTRRDPNPARFDDEICKIKCSSK